MLSDVNNSKTRLFHVKTIDLNKIMKNDFIQFLYCFFAYGFP